MQSSLNSNQSGSLTSLTCLSLALYQRPTLDKTVRLMARDGDKLTLNVKHRVEGGGDQPSCPSLQLTHIASILRWNQWQEFLDDALIVCCERPFSGNLQKILQSCSQSIYCSYSIGEKADLCHEETENAL